MTGKGEGSKHLFGTLDIDKFSRSTPTPFMIKKAMYPLLIPRGKFYFYSFLTNP